MRAAMRKAETLLGALTAALALVALVPSLTQQAVEYVSPSLPTGGGPKDILAAPIILNATSAPVVLVGVGALLVCVGAIADARIRRKYRAFPLAMIVIGAVLCAGALEVTSLANIYLYAGSLPYDSSQSLPLAAWVAQIPHMSLSLFYAPVAVVSGACALAALFRHQSRRHSTQASHPESGNRASV